jgi:hypothetical protein
MPLRLSATAAAGAGQQRDLWRNPTDSKDAIAASDGGPRLIEYVRADRQPTSDAPRQLIPWAGNRKAGRPLTDAPLRDPFRPTV